MSAVVIDLNDMGQIKRLAAAYDAQTEWKLTDEPMTMGEARMRQALRSLLTPPKPPEPTGQGAVVEDAVGKRWVRMGSSKTAQWFQPSVEPPARAKWSDLTAVKVLSEGVTP